jgi:hypothetical protein
LILLVIHHNLWCNYHSKGLDVSIEMLAKISTVQAELPYSYFTVLSLLEAQLSLSHQVD